MPENMTSRHVTQRAVNVIRHASRKPRDASDGLVALISELLIIRQVATDCNCLDSPTSGDADVQMCGKEVESLSF